MSLTATIAAIFGLAGVALVVVNLAIAVRAKVRGPMVRHISGIPIVGGAIACVAMLFFESTRPWAWVPLAIDPSGVLPLLVALMRGPGPRP